MRHWVVLAPHLKGDNSINLKISRIGTSKKPNCSLWISRSLNVVFNIFYHKFHALRNNRFSTISSPPFKNASSESCGLIGFLKRMYFKINPHHICFNLKRFPFLFIFTISVLKSSEPKQVILEMMPVCLFGGLQLKQKDQFKSNLASGHMLIISWGTFSITEKKTTSFLLGVAATRKTHKITILKNASNDFSSFA